MKLLIIIVAVVAAWIYLPWWLALVITLFVVFKVKA